MRDLASSWDIRMHFDVFTHVRCVFILFGQNFQSTLTKRIRKIRLQVKMEVNKIDIF